MIKFERGDIVTSENPLTGIRHKTLVAVVLTEMFYGVCPSTRLTVGGSNASVLSADKPKDGNEKKIRANQLSDWER